jgi:DNA-binding MarR family transcriptional regulator
MGTADNSLDEIQRALITFSRSTKVHARSFGLSFVTATILVYIDSAAEPHATGLADEYGLDKSTVSRQLADLESQGLLRRVIHATRPRTQLLKLTAKGERVLSAARTRHRTRLAETLENWPKADVVELSRLLSRFVVDLDRHDTAADRSAAS